jgi:hypothetical protein
MLPKRCRPEKVSEKGRVEGGRGGCLHAATCTDSDTLVRLARKETQTGALIGFGLATCGTDSLLRIRTLNRGVYVHIDLSRRAANPGSRADGTAVPPLTAPALCANCSVTHETVIK